MTAGDVYQGQELIGRLERHARGIRFSAIAGATLPHGWVATTLPHETADFAELPNFFLNLLPEGARLQLLLDSARSRDDALELLLRVGWDTIGDIAVLPSGEKPGTRRARVAVKDLGQVSFWELFRAGASDNADSAIPGVQEKVSAATVAFGVRAKGAPSAILKLNPRQFPRLVQNEAFFLRMAKGCRLEVNRAQIVHDREGEPGLLVQRFDRKDRGTEKLHQEDGCQLLDSPPANKYQPSMRAIADRVAETCSSPMVEVERLMRLTAFSYIIGNSDLHAKNISVLWDEVVRLSPGYDLLSTLPYKELDQHMALSIQGKNDNLRRGEFIDFGRIYGIGEVAAGRMIGDLCDLAEPWIERVVEIGFDPHATELLQSEMAKRIAKLRR
jgi:serine/threonine-protein kinase HipA